MIAATEVQASLRPFRSFLRSSRPRSTVPSSVRPLAQPASHGTQSVAVTEQARVSRSPRAGQPRATPLRHVSHRATAASRRYARRSDPPLSPRRHPLATSAGVECVSRFPEESDPYFRSVSLLPRGYLRPGGSVRAGRVPCPLESPQPPPEPPTARSRGTNLRSPIAARRDALPVAFSPEKLPPLSAPLPPSATVGRSSGEKFSGPELSPESVPPRM